MNKADKHACPRELTFLQLGKGKQTNNRVRNKKSLYYVRKCKMLWKKVAQEKGETWEGSTFG